MIERSSFRRILTATVIAASFGLAGVAGAGAAEARQVDPNPTQTSTGCKYRQVKEQNGYWYECDRNGKWVKLPPLGRA